ncbi:protein FAM98A [Myripristis murdjan]|uniref:Im:7138535 n=1 Tax=Myripristis murdjan TaxID=586833 RepID=A0A667XYU8_9TELE|nr:protein FAM98A-like [Myripristis murdjan]
MTAERSAGTVSAIKALGYPNSSCISRCTCDELPCPLLTWLATELCAACPDLPDRRGELLLVGELRDLLAKMLSPLTELTSDVLGPPLLNKVTEFLVSELQAAHILKYKELHPEDKTVREESEKEQRVDDHSHDQTEFFQEYEGGDVSDTNRKTAETQVEFTSLLQALDLSASSQFPDVLHEVESRLACLPSGDMTEPLLNTSLSSEQWGKVEKINQLLSEDYQCRRQMIIKRFQVTLESFAWGDKEKEHRETLASVPPLASLASSTQVSLSLLLAARKDQSNILPVRPGPSTAVYKVLMGSVPDRGGRPGEIEPPMPLWEGRREQGKRSGRGGGRHQRQKFSGKKKKGKKE